jgi:hypothetical protein
MTNGESRAGPGRSSGTRAREHPLEADAEVRLLVYQFTRYLSRAVFGPPWNSLIDPHMAQIFADAVAQVRRRKLAGLVGGAIVRRIFGMRERFSRGGMLKFTE